MNRNDIIGRENEIKILDRICRRKESSLIAVYGRRRVGKTFLINSYFENRFAFKITGAYQKDLAFQLATFAEELSLKSGQEKMEIHSWRVAFSLLGDYLLSLPKDEKKIVFFDEMPWLETPNSGFIHYLSLFWNNVACTIDHLVFIACGSSSLWMNAHFVKDRGGFFQRKHALIRLEPFKLYEVEQYLISRGFSYARADIATLYMILGGIPYYLNFLDPSMTLNENMDFLLFSPQAELKGEFSVLYKTLFSDSPQYLRILKALAETRKGMNKKTITSKLSIPDNGDLTEKMENLMLTGFIRSCQVRNGRKQTYYQLIDFFTIFYFKYIEGNDHASSHYFTSIAQSPSFLAYRGLTFELVCQTHIDEIKYALQFFAIEEEHYAWESTFSEPGAQIDILIRRKDHVDLIIESKFISSQLEITKAMYDDFSRKIEVYRNESKTKNSIIFVLITSFGIFANRYSNIAQKSLLLDDLFLKVR